ncbi:MAG: C factor, cell signaling protein, partial [Pseudomonadota bacterium]
MGHALVIGASGGIGAALADQLAQAHTVTRISRSEDGLDVADDASVATLMAPVQAPVDLAFMATGILAPPGGAPEKTL